MNERGAAAGGRAPAQPDTARAIIAGDTHTCAVLDDGTVRCWGSNGNGELGLGDIDNRGVNAGQMGDNLSLVDIAP